MTSLGGRLDRRVLAALLLLVGLAWSGVLRLPLSGEDWAMLARVEQGQRASPHVFRPWSDGWLALLHAVFGPSALALHAGSLLLHLVNAGLIAVVALELLGSTLGVLVVTLAFGLGAGVCDSLAWIAAVNRPLSACGVLLAWLGLLRLGTPGRGGLALFFAGLLLQLGANEEVYGTALLAIAWLGGSALWLVTQRRVALLGAGGALALILLHYFVLNPIELTPNQVRPSLAFVASGVVARAEEIGAGFALPGWASLALPLGAWLALLVAREWRAALFGAAAWGAALIPFVLSEPTPYRAYPSQAPTALLTGAALHVLLARLGAGPRARLLAGGLALALALLASHRPRNEQLGRWRAALEEVAVVARDARLLAREGGEAPVLINLEPTSAGPFFYAFGVLEPTALRVRGFLDAPSAYEEPGDRPPGLWYGRRFDGSHGRIDPSSYFAGRPRIEPLALYEHALPVGSAAEVERRLRDPAVDLTTSVIVEASAAELGLLEANARAPDGAGAPEPGTIAVLVPFEFGRNWARTTVAARPARPALLVYQEHWLFESLSRLSADQALHSRRTDLRRVALEARERSTGAMLPVFRANVFGFAVPLAPGAHELELAWSVRRDL